MEDVEVIRRFLTPIGSGSGYGDGYGSGYGYGDGSGSGYGSGSGSGYGDGYGSGSGSGSGSGYGYGDGSGYGYGDGYGDGSGSGLKEYNGRPVWYVDGLPTLIDSVHNNRYAKGFIVKGDLSLQPCYIARAGNCWAHGETLRKAMADAQAKWMEERPLEERIEEFRNTHPDLDKPYGDLFEWHHILTGSCEMGRREWCAAHGYQPTDTITVRTFIKQTLNDYGGDAIKQLGEAYGLKRI